MVLGEMDIARVNLRRLYGVSFGWTGQLGRTPPAAGSHSSLGRPGVHKIPGGRRPPGRRPPGIQLGCWGMGVNLGEHRN